MKYNIKYPVRLHVLNNCCPSSLLLWYKAILGFGCTSNLYVFVGEYLFSETCSPTNQKDRSCWSGRVTLHICLWARPDWGCLGLFQVKWSLCGHPFKPGCRRDLDWFLVRWAQTLLADRASRSIVLGSWGRTEWWDSAGPLIPAPTTW